MPFLAWNVIGMIFRVLMDNRLPFDGISDLLLEFSFFPFDGPLWYIFCLMLLLPLLPVIRRIRSKGIHIIILLCFSAISILLYAKIGNSASSALVDWGCRLIYYLPLYYLGVYCGLYHGYDIFMDKYKGASFAITGGVILMLTIILFLTPLQSEVCIQVLTLLMPIAIWFMIPSQWFGKSPSVLYKVSFLIYASHILLLALLESLSYRLVGTILLTSYQVIFVKLSIVAASIMIVYWSVLFIKRIMPSNAISIFTGGRL